MSAIDISAASVPRKSWRVPEAAQALGVSVPTLYRWARLGHVKLIKTGGITSMPDAELVRLSNEGTRERGAAA